MTAVSLLSRLKGVRQTGPGSWLARCPAHDDFHPSLSVCEVDGKVLVHCFAGCAVHDVVEAVGLSMADLFPEKPTHRGKPHRPAFPAADVLRAVANEALVVSMAASNMSTGAALGAEDRDRLRLAAARLNTAVEESGYA